MKIEIRPGLFLVDDSSKSHSLVRGLQLLSTIEKEGNLQAASNAMGISYRTIWTAEPVRPEESPQYVAPAGP